MIRIWIILLGSALVGILAVAAQDKPVKEKEAKKGDSSTITGN